MQFYVTIWRTVRNFANTIFLLSSRFLSIFELSCYAMHEDKLKETDVYQVYITYGKIALSFI